MMTEDMDLVREYARHNSEEIKDNRLLWSNHGIDSVVL
jgi:hypothetical protein